MRGGRDFVRKRHDAELSRALDLHPAGTGLHRFFGVDHRNGFGCARIDTKGFLDQGQRLCGVEVANDGNGGIVRPVKRVIELAQPLDRHLLDVAAMPDGAVVIRVCDKRRLIDLLVQRLHRRIFAALKLIAHHGHLRAPVLIAQQQIAHTVRFHVDGASQVLAAKVLVIVCAIQPGGGVVAGAGALKQLVDVVALAAVALRRTLEHHVFQNMGRARATGHLILGADAVSHHEGQRRARMLG